jgi:hypothetical protein
MMREAPIAGIIESHNFITGSHDVTLKQVHTRSTRTCLMLS